MGVHFFRFLNLDWKEGVRHWRKLDGQAHRVDALFKRLPPSATALEAYARFLHDIGEQSLPQGCVIIADRLRAGDAASMLTRTSTVFYLEVLLRRAVYGEPLRLKRDPVVRAAVLSLLDNLVEAGSSAAYRMRDDFVTKANKSIAM